MLEATENTVGQGDASLAGRQLYSPGTIAAYTVLANLPMGMILYGLNLKARGRRGFGQAMLLFGGASLAMFLFLSVARAIPAYATTTVAAVGAINVYQLEKRPFERALLHGAVRAKWWPPAVVLIAVLALSAILQYAL